jgi:hypothetical protein
VVGIEVSIDLKHGEHVAPSLGSKANAWRRNNHIPGAEWAANGPG